MADRTESWQAQATTLTGAIKNAARVVENMVQAPSAAYTDAQRAHLNAVKTYNDFLSTDKAVYKVVDQIQHKLDTDSTLSVRNVPNSRKSATT